MHSWFVRRPRRPSGTVRKRLRDDDAPHPPCSREPAKNRFGYRRFTAGLSVFAGRLTPRLTPPPKGANEALCRTHATTPNVGSSILGAGSVGKQINVQCRRVRDT